MTLHGITSGSISRHRLTTAGTAGGFLAGGTPWRMRPSVRWAIYEGGCCSSSRRRPGVAGLPFSFPSLGPTAYLLAVAPGARRAHPAAYWADKPTASSRACSRTRARGRPRHDDAPAAVDDWATARCRRRRLGRPQPAGSSPPTSATRRRARRRSSSRSDCCLASSRAASSWRLSLLFATRAVLDPGERMVYILTNMINRIKRRGLLPTAVSVDVAGCLSSSTEEDEYPTGTPDSDYCDCLPVRPPAVGQSIPERLTVITMRLP